MTNRYFVKLIKKKYTKTSLWKLFKNLLQSMNKYFFIGINETEAVSKV